MMTPTVMMMTTMMTPTVMMMVMIMMTMTTIV